MIITEMSSVKDAEQKYKNYLEIVHAFCKKDLSQNKRYVKKMCDLYFEEGVSFNDICSLFAVYEDNKGIFDAVGLNFNQYSYQELFKMVYKASGDYADKCKLPNEIIQSEDKTVSLGLFRTFEEAMNFEGVNSWCICVSKGRFEENTADGTLLYIIRNLRFSKGSDCRFVVAQVFNNGTKIYWASNDSKLTDKHEGGHPSIAEYENTINEVLPYIKPKSDDNNNNQQDTNMKTENKKRNVVRLTESQLKQMIAESVKKVLKEWNSDDDFICHGCKAWSNWGGVEMQISDDGDEARLRYPDGEITDWLEIEYDEEGVAYITAPNGEIERFDEYERVR